MGPDSFPSEEKQELFVGPVPAFRPSGNMEKIGQETNGQIFTSANT